MTNSPLSLIRTSNEQAEAVDLLEEMLAENFKNSPHPKNANKSAFLSKFYSLMLEMIHGAGGSREAADKLLKDSLDEVKNLKEIKITLAVYPDEVILNSLENWLNTNGLEAYIFDITVDKKIIGGAIIAGDKGEYRDFSLNKRLNAYLTGQILTS